MQGTNSRDDHAFNINFVKIIKKKRCLYDKTLPEYRNKDEHEKAWEQIASELNENVPHCKERWRNLRACLTRHLKNSKQQIATGNTNYKPYYLAEHMKFVLPYTKSRQRDNVIVTEENTNAPIQVQKIEIDEYDDEKSSEPEPPALTIQTMMASSPNPTTRFVFVPPISSTPNAPVKRSAAAVEQESRPEGDNPDNVAASVEKKLKTKPDATATAVTEIDDSADLNFFKSLLPDIRQMTPAQKRKFKMGIFELINNIVD
ncbi:uncharacterized protein LOC119072823 [Bradysia coprophila]|uniref:uncharacterized protein LOC119072823 n=1 Tax=Bradysia coprophila TaxID=38358 RepID=UPI00187D881B|nr:uncharacterized protein LOC119072823 [Bradysia coprophila]